MTGTTEEDFEGASRAALNKAAPDGSIIILLNAERKLRKESMFN